MVIKFSAATARIPEGTAPGTPPARSTQGTAARAERGAAITGCGNNTRIPAPKRTAGERFQVPERIAFLMTGRHTFTPEDGAFPAAAYPFPEIPMLTSSQKVFDVLEFLCANGPHKALEVAVSDVTAEQQVCDQLALVVLLVLESRQVL